MQFLPEQLVLRGDALGPQRSVCLGTGLQFVEPLFLEALDDVVFAEDSRWLGLAHTGRGLHADPAGNLNRRSTFVLHVRADVVFSGWSSAVVTWVRADQEYNLCQQQEFQMARYYEIAITQ